MDNISHDSVGGYLKIGEQYTISFVGGLILPIVLKRVILDPVGKPITIISNQDAIYNWDNIIHIYKTPRLS